MKERVTEVIQLEGFQVEFTIVGEGEPIFVLHGGHSNCNEEFGYDFLIEQGYSLITPSRPGYGKSSKEMGESISVACDFYVKLLNHLNLDKIHVLAISAGGPSGIYFASKYPHFVKTLILQSAVTKEWLTPKDIEYKVASKIFHPKAEKVTWKLISFMNNKFPSFIFKQMFPSFSSLNYKEAKEKIAEWDTEEIRKMNNRQRSGYGFLIDLQQVNDLTVDDLESVACPTLIMHSKFDGSVPLDHAYFAHESISSSELCLLDTWGHLIWLGTSSYKTNEAAVKFLNKYKIEKTHFTKVK
ncbi:alpha/beta fold hydrolase [Lysinibacillus sp. SGAir0095]|uniref:alpha/beta fold hydrolase n=1 Tax=Lysinibacillus sp. SGAir0095 TaxID=2070463 RepID=UPI0010CCB271|nr:alpha/beta hydrolase [Lysinibacillus sp. SGAir0095]QCR34119.1 alpha/beta hydrolase [Lysinibacillus sp. SGAir0095]